MRIIVVDGCCQRLQAQRKSYGHKFRKINEMGVAMMLSNL